MSIESRNVEIEPINCAYAVLTEHISEFLRIKLEETRIIKKEVNKVITDSEELGVDGFIDCRVVVRFEYNNKTKQKEHEMYVVAFFSNNSKDINSMASKNNNNGSNIFLDKMDKPNSVNPTDLLRRRLAPFTGNEKIIVNRDDSSTYSIDLDIYRVFGMMFDADFIKEEIVVIKYDKISDINFKFTVVKQYVTSGRNNDHKDSLSMKANRRFNNR